MYPHFLICPFCGFSIPWDHEQFTIAHNFQVPYQFCNHSALVLCNQCHFKASECIFCRALEPSWGNRMLAILLCAQQSALHVHPWVGNLSIPPAESSLSYTVLYKGLEHPSILASAEAPGTKSPQIRKANCISFRCIIHCFLVTS